MPDGVLAFHAGTASQGGKLVTSGGRVLGIAAQAGSLPAALEKAYRSIEGVHFEGMHYRTDIGRHAGAQAGGEGSAYAAAGVSIDAGARAVELMSASLRKTYTAQVLSDVGTFGGLYSLSGLADMQHPVLVASTDGVGTKVILAAQAGRFEGIGQDIVNHCINDILVQGARPLFFLDYIAASHLEPVAVAEIVRGMSTACFAAGCALLGGETAEMPGVYAPERFDVAGTIVGVVEKDCILPRPGIQAGDYLLGLASSGPHTNGFSLIRRVLASTPLDTVNPEVGVPLIDALLAPHRSYLALLWGLLQAGFAGNPEKPSPIKALCHLTGGGFIDNLPRILPAGLGAVIRRGAWPVPPLFQLIQRQGQVSELEMHRVFNMGVGMLAVVSPQDLEQVQGAIPEKTWVVGEIAPGAGVRLV